MLAFPYPIPQHQEGLDQGGDLCMLNGRMEKWWVGG